MIAVARRSASRRAPATPTRRATSSGTASASSTRSTAIGEPTVFLRLPTSSLIPHSRHWKAQVPYLSRHFRVVTFDGRGNGRSDRPQGAEPTRSVSLRRTAGRPRRDRRPSALFGGVWMAAARGSCSPPSIRSASPARHRRAVVPGSRRRTALRVFPLRRAARYRRGLGQVQHATTGGATGAASSSSSSRSSFRSRTRRSRSRTASAGGSRRPRPHRSRPTSRRRLRDRGRFRELCERVRCPVLVIHGDQDASRRAAARPVAEPTGGSS